MHHVPYTHVLHSGKTVIQHIYDSHYDGAAEAAQFVERWRALEGRDRRRRDTAPSLPASSTRPATRSCGATPCASTSVG